MKLTRVTNDPSSIRRIINNKAAGATNAAGKESACNVGDLSSIPGLGRYPGEGNSYPPQYFALENFMDRGAWQATVHGAVKSQK